MTVDVSWDDQVETYLGALSRGDRTSALGQVRGLRTEGYDVMVLIRRLLAPAQLRVGELWVSDTWSVAQEHAATAISEAVLTSLAVERELSAEPRLDAPKVVVSCVNPLGFDKAGAFGLDVWQGSAAEAAAALLPESTVVGAFHHLSAVTLITDERLHRCQASDPGRTTPCGRASGSTPTTA